MSEESGKVYVTKIAAAQRQLDAAIRMVFAGEDELAVHTVVAAAYRVVRDLRKKRGLDEKPNEAVAIGFFYIARAYAMGKENKLPASVRQWAETDQQVRDFSEVLQHKQANLGRPVELEDFEIDAFNIDERKYWSNLASTGNFLKHADMDADRLLNASKADTPSLLGSAISSFIILMGRPTPEMRVYGIFHRLDFDDPGDLDELDLGIFNKLRTIPADHRGHASLEIIKVLKDLE